MLGLLVLFGVGLYRLAARHVGGSDDLASEAMRPRLEPMATRRQRTSNSSIKQVPAGATHLIEYGDAFGEVTERPIRLERVYEEPSGNIYAEGFCFLRMEQRTFRADRMLRLVDVSSGQDIRDPVSFFDQHPQKESALPGTAGGRWDRVAAVEYQPAPVEPIFDTPESHDRVMARARAGLLGLLWLAAADGDVSAPEIDVMLAWITYRATPLNARRDGAEAEDWHREAALYWISRQRPTFALTATGLTAMGKAEAVRFVEMMEDLMSADGEKTKLEQGRAARLLVLLPKR